MTMRRAIPLWSLVLGHWAFIGHWDLGLGAWVFASGAPRHSLPLAKLRPRLEAIDMVPRSLNSPFPVVHYPHAEVLHQAWRRPDQHGDDLPGPRRGPARPAGDVLARHG